MQFQINTISKKLENFNIIFNNYNETEYSQKILINLIEIIGDCILELKKQVKISDNLQKILNEISTNDQMDELFNEAYDFIRLGNEQDGIDKITEFIKKNPKVWNAWFLLGWAHRRLSQYTEGKKAFEHALEIGPEHSDTLNELAICQLELQEYPQCRKTLEKALIIEPGNVKIISNLGILSLKEEKLEEAERHFRLVLELSPEDPIATNYLEFIANNP